MSLPRDPSLSAPAVGKQTANEASTRSGRRMVRIYSVEGGIGVGKTTVMDVLADEFKNVPSVKLIPEPVDTWMEHGLLQAMYEGSNHLGQFQQMVLSTLVSPLLCALMDPEVEVVITERSPWSNFSIFASTNLVGIDMTSFRVTYHSLMLPLEQVADLEVCLFVLAAPVEVAMERIKTRGRECEENIDVSYMRSLHEAHEKMKSAPPPLFRNPKGEPAGSSTVSVEEIDASLPAAQVALQISERISVV